MSTDERHQVLRWDQSLRWDNEAIYFKEYGQNGSVQWKDLVAVYFETKKIDDTFRYKDMILRLDVWRGNRHQIPLSVLSSEEQFEDLVETVKRNSQSAPIHGLERLRAADATDVIKLWTDGSGVNHKRNKAVISGTIILFAVGWIIALSIAMHVNITASWGGNLYFLFQILKLLPLAFIPLYGRLLPVTKFRLGPSLLTAEATIGGSSVVKKKIEWKNIVRAELTDETEKQHGLHRSLKLVMRNGSAYPIRLETIGSSKNWRRLYSALAEHSNISLNAVTADLFDKINPAQDDPGYTQIWLDSLLAPARRERLIPLAVDSVLQQGEYVLVHKLGAGGQGCAYLANSKDGRSVVLKEYILPVYVDAKIRRRAVTQFESEARILQHLDSPLIVKLLNFFIEDHRAYLVLENIEGSNLREFVNNNGPLTEEQAIDCAMSMCDALEYLHNQVPPIIHRDFTPENVMLCADGTVKVIDFMVAQQNEDSVTATVVGKHAYLPPEQFRGDATRQSDIYALGGTLFFLLTGHDPEPLSSSHPILLNDTICGALDELVAKATAYELAERIRDAGEFKRELLKITHDQ